ncbi:hypothetical protein K466DRAFT_373055 [Polyporus arcularius HHB13444]|uniref:Uncharacterized protein n=1 Tax=Polyporus arcularius HHB13444 TaxID=1314778 RepID=A0A5C3P486_9APHY|nr:hypothetical protein K466DRAFT_373055 [Polyporus arcularius HHB13444]
MTDRDRLYQCTRNPSLSEFPSFNIVVPLQRSKVPPYRRLAQPSAGELQVSGGLHPSRRALTPSLRTPSRSRTPSRRDRPLTYSAPTALNPGLSFHAVSAAVHSARFTNACISISPSCYPRFSSSLSMTSMPTPVLHRRFCTHPSWERTGLVAQAPSVEFVPSLTQDLL